LRPGRSELEGGAGTGQVERTKVRTARIDRTEMASEQDVSSFIQATFRSVWALELLCYLRQNRDRGLSHAEMVSGLRGSDLVVSQSVGSLAAAGLILVEADGSARYAPASEDLDVLVERTQALYSRSPDAVRRMIVSATSPGISAFADAFKLRKD
jgi:hypothetical protein